MVHKGHSTVFSVAPTGPHGCFPHACITYSVKSDFKKTQKTKKPNKSKMEIGSPVKLKAKPPSPPQDS